MAYAVRARPSIKTRDRNVRFYPIFSITGETHRDYILAFFPLTAARYSRERNINLHARRENANARGRTVRENSAFPLRFLLFHLG